MDWPLRADHQQLVSELATLIARGGAWRFLRAPVVAANVTDYPDRWEENRAGVARVVARTLWHAYLDIDAVIEDVRRPDVHDRKRLRDTQLELAAMTAAGARFTLASIGNDDVAGLVSHEIGRAFVATLARDGHPFRTADDGLPSLRLGTIATVYLGLGVVATNSARHDRSAGETVGRTSLHEHKISQHGGLDSRELALLLAVQAVVRDDVLPALATLRPTQAMDVAAWRAVLDDHEAELRVMLGLAADGDAAAELDDPASAPTRSAAPREVTTTGELDERNLFKQNYGRRVFRYAETRGVTGGVLGTLGGAGVGLGAVIAFAVPVIALATSVVGLVGGAIYGLRRRVYHCASCYGAVTPTDATCARCGGTIAGEIAHAGLRLEKEEELEEADRVAAATSPTTRTSSGDDGDQNAG